MSELLRKRVQDFRKLTKNCDKNMGDKHWPFWYRNYALVSLLQIRSNTFGAITDYGKKKHEISNLKRIDLKNVENTEFPQKRRITFSLSLAEHALICK